MPKAREPVPPDEDGDRPVAQRPPAEAKEPRVPKLQADLVYLGEKMGAAIAVWAPLTGTTFAVKTPEAAAGLVLLAKKNDALRRGLQSLVKVSAYSYVADFAASVVVAAAVEVGRLSPDAIIAQHLGVTEIADQVAEAQQQAAAQDADQDAEGVDLGPAEDGAGLLGELRAVAGAPGAA